MSDAWARLCESVWETPETVLLGYALVGKPASLGRLIESFGMPLKREKRRTRRALRKARFALAVELQRAMRGPFLLWEEAKRELGTDREDGSGD
jgi:hypothetical protein